MALARNICIGFDPETEIVHNFSWDIAPDLNNEGKTLLCGYVPHTKGSTISPLQETLFIGGISLGKMYQTLKNDLAQDDGSNFTAEAILNDIDPTLLAEGLPDTKRFVRVDFTQDNPYTNGLSLEYCANVNDLPAAPTAWTAFTHAAGSIRAFFNSTIARHVNIRVRKTGAVAPTVPLFSGFVLQFYRLGSRKGDDS